MSAQITSGPEPDWIAAVVRALDVVAVDGLDRQLDAERLLALGGDVLLEDLIGRRHEIDPAQPVHGLGLGEGRGPSGRQDAGHSAGRGDGPCAGNFQQLAPRDSRHGFLSVGILFLLAPRRPRTWRRRKRRAAASSAATLPLPAGKRRASGPVGYA
ncbi:MAG: hypothetical protein WDO24_24920 [Pseudomonadota bacterium]